MQQHEIKAKRIAVGLTQQELGEKAGISKASARALISAYEVGNGRDKPNEERLKAIERVLDIAEQARTASDALWARL